MGTLAILGWGTAVPRFQLTGAAVGSVLGTPPGKKSRAIASWDEDTTTLAVAGAGAALRAVPGFEPGTLTVATSTPAYLRKSSAATVHAALSLPARCRSVDAGPATRSGVTAVQDALLGAGPSLVVVSDTRLEASGASGELDGGDAAAAFVVGEPTTTSGSIATLAATASSTIEIFDRWQLPDERFGLSADERSTEAAYLAATSAVLTDLFGSDDRGVDVLVVATEHQRVRSALAVRPGVDAARVVTSVPGLGCAGAADAGLLLAHALETATAGERVLLLSVADGVDALLLNITGNPADNRAPTVADQVDSARKDLPYVTYLKWRDLLSIDAGRRPPLAAPAPSPTLRNTGWKYGLVATRCRKCETAHLPPARTCRSCGVVDEMDDYPLAHQGATIKRITTDRLAWSPQPPLVQAIVEFDDGGRLRCEVTDTLDGDLKVGDRVTMSFRVLRTVDGIHNYFWKAVPARTVKGVHP